MQLLTCGSQGSAFIEAGAMGIWIALFTSIPVVSGSMTRTVFGTLAAQKSKFV
jgi:hypothetical protein